MSAPTFPTANWTGTANMTTFRRDYVRDLVDTTTTPKTYLSAYNKATQGEFFSDVSVDAIKSRVETDYAEELLNVYNTKYYLRIGAGDDTTTADTSANAVLLDATMRLVRAECRANMMTDAGFIGSIVDEKERTALFALWANEIEHDRTFERTRAGSFGSIPLMRF